MNITNFENQCIAIAGIAQAAHIVDNIALTGEYPEEYVKASITSIFTFNLFNTITVYGDISGIGLGLETLLKIFSSKQNYTKTSVVRYMLAMIHMQQIIKRDPNLISEIFEKLRADVNEGFRVTKSLLELCDEAAKIYTDTMGKLQFKIYVNGDKNFIHRDNNEKIIRAVLLSGVRAAFLWQQFGGRRWKLIFQRAKLVNAVTKLSHQKDLI